MQSSGEADSTDDSADGVSHGEKQYPAIGPLHAQPFSNTTNLGSTAPGVGWGGKSQVRARVRLAFCRPLHLLLHLCLSDHCGCATAGGALPHYVGARASKRYHIAASGKEHSTDICPQLYTAEKLCVASSLLQSSFVKLTKPLRTPLQPRSPRSHEQPRPSSSRFAKCGAV